jgi:nicotinamidase-related amidase
MPIFVCCREEKSEALEWPHREFACEMHGCIWKNEAFTKALDAEDCTALVIAGYWLDREVLVATLYALADRYEVYIPVDASPAHSKEAARLTEVRLLHSGATPLLTKQVLYEWMIEASAADKQAALMSLMT